MSDAGGASSEPASRDGAELEPGDGGEPRVRADGLVEDTASAPLVVRRRGRRVSTGPVDGASREPSPEPRQTSENDDRLRGDKPPHWG